MILFIQHFEFTLTQFLLTQIIVCIQGQRGLVGLEGTAGRPGPRGEVGLPGLPGERGPLGQKVNTIKSIKTDLQKLFLNCFSLS